MPRHLANPPKLDNMGFKGRMQGVLLVAAAAVTAVAVQPLSASAVAPTETAPVAVQQRDFDRPVARVASFNIRSVKNDVGAAGDEQPWRERRGAVIRQILGEHLDVLGVQEASQNGKYTRQLVDGRNQFLDLRNGLRKAGGHWQLTSTASYNCERPYASHDCKYQDRGASRTTKILYNTRKVEKIRSGSYLHRHVDAEVVRHVGPQAHEPGQPWVLDDQAVGLRELSLEPPGQPLPRPGQLRRASGELPRLRPAVLGCHVQLLQQAGVEVHHPTRFPEALGVRLVGGHLRQRDVETEPCSESADQAGAAATGSGHEEEPRPALQPTGTGCRRHGRDCSTGGSGVPGPSAVSGRSA